MKKPLVAALSVPDRTSVDLFQLIHEACDRIEKIESRVRSLLPEVGRRDRLLGQATLLLDRFPDSQRRPGLFGTLVGVKDIFNVDGLPTRAGSAFLPEEFEGVQAASVTRLLDAGALILGKTVTTEFAYLEPGATSNPHDTRCTPGGSSSGSAASVAAGIASLALGTQTVGSVIRPASFCGVTGFKPSYGRIPTEGILEFSPSVDHVGFFSTSVEDLRRAAEVLCDEWSAAKKETALQFAVPDGPYLDQTEPEARTVFERQIERIADAGCRILRRPALAEVEQVARRHMDLIAAEYAEVHAERFELAGSLVRARSAEFFDQGRRVTEEERGIGFASRAILREELQSLMEEDGIQAWICPAATGPAPLGLSHTGDAAMNLPWTHSGLPAATVPAGLIGRLPVGVQLVARYGDDEGLLAAAAFVENALRPR